MLKKLSHADDRYREIEQMLTLPEVIANNKEYQKLIKEYNKLSEIVLKYREFLKAEREMSSKLLMSRGCIFMFCFVYPWPTSLDRPLIKSN